MRLLLTVIVCGSLPVGLLQAGDRLPRVRAKVQELKAKVHAKHAPVAVVPSPKHLSLPRVTTVEEQKATTLPRIEVHDKLVGNGQELDVRYKEERCKVVVWVTKPREVEKEIILQDVRPVKVTDPCTGKCTTRYECVPKVRTIKVTVYEVVPEEQEVLIKVPKVLPGTAFAVKKLTAHPTSIPGVKKRFDAVVAPNHIVLPPEPLGCPCPK